MLLERKNWRSHLPWFVFAVVATLAATVWYFAASWGRGDWPGGSSVPGFTFGVLGALIILFELLLWPRKEWGRMWPHSWQMARWRWGPLKLWMRAHIWLGLLAVPLLVYHSGFRLGGPLSTLTLGLFLIVIASGVWGLLMQNWLPQRMLEDLPAETIAVQIGHVMRVHAAAARTLVEGVCGPRPAAAVAHAADNGVPARPAPEVVASLDRARGRILVAMPEARAVRGAEPMRAFYQDTVEPYLLHGRGVSSPLRAQASARRLFGELRDAVPAEAYPAVQAPQDLTDLRRQLDTQGRMNFWLHCWLWVHLPLSVALGVFMVLHAYKAVQYW